MLRPVERMDCRRAEDLLEAFLDGELRAAESSTLEAHLAGCAECREELALARRLQVALQALPELDPPPRVRRDALAAAAAAGAPGTTRRWPWLAAAAALILAILIPILGSLHRQAFVAAQDPELERAIHDSRLAMALVASVSRRTGVEIRKETVAHRLVEPAVDRMLRPLHRRMTTKPESTPRTAAPDNPPTRSTS